MGRNLSADGRDRLQTLGHVTATIGHQVINSFSAIVSGAELIKIQLNAQPPQTNCSDVSDFVDSIVRNALDASVVMRRLIDFSHRITDAGQDRDGRVREPVDLNALLLQLIEGEESEANGEVVWRLNLGSLPMILGDSRQLRIAFRELFRNAREALPAGTGTISVRTRVDKQGWIVIEIRDSGIGITRENLGRALEPFFSTKEGHLGVGLAIARGIWRRHQGALSIIGPSTEGTVIRLTVEPAKESAGLDLLRPRADERVGST